MIRELQHKHRGYWWPLGSRTEKQINAILAMAVNVERVGNVTYFDLPSMFSESHFRIVEE